MEATGGVKPDGEAEYQAKVTLGDAAPKQWGCHEHGLGQADVEGGALVYVTETVAQAVELHTAVCGTFAGVTDARWIRGPLSRLLEQARAGHGRRMRHTVAWISTSPDLGAPGRGGHTGLDRDEGAWRG